MQVLGAIIGFLLIVMVLFDAFETVILPRRVTRPYRFVRFFYRNSWKLWRALVPSFLSKQRRENFLSYFAPLSLLILFCIWMFGLVVGFAFMHWSLDIPLNTPDRRVDFVTYTYMSGVTFFTLGFGDVTAANTLGRMLTVAEAGIGFGFLACLIGYLPVFYQVFSHREVTIALLDARAGSPPTCGELLSRMSRAGNMAALLPFLAEWERWAAEVLESHLSYPLLSFYRSQHDNQSWLAALTVILDCCAVMIASVRDPDPYQAQLTFAMARHVVVDLALLFNTPPETNVPDRMTPECFAQLRETLRQSGLILRDGAAVNAKLIELRGMYEPFVMALSKNFLFPIPPFVAKQQTVDNWQTSAWTRRTPGIGKLPMVDGEDEHFV